MNNRGMTSIELLVSFVIISFVAIGMFSAVFDILDKIEVYQKKISMTIMKGNITNSVQKDLKLRKLYGYTSCGTNCYEFTYQDGTTKKLKVDLTNNTVLYGSIAEKVPKGFTITGNMTLSRDTYTASEGKNDTVLRINIPISNVALKINGTINLVHQYDNRVTGNFLNTFANAPVLATGMTPIKWNGSAWVDTTTDDQNWYSYDAVEKEWANAKTADGSMWVWIPRYIYKISTGWHEANGGTIEVQFTKGTNDNWNSASIGSIDTGTTSNASNNKWTNHPAFTFGTTELTGIWVAKFEASGTTSAIDIKPNVTSLRSQTIGTFFTTARNMETNTRYGWGTTGSGIDTHLMKSTEWGAVVYLANSPYGKNSEIWINPSTSFITGCAGASVSAASESGCPNAYNTTNGMQASTTGNVYGLYDISGGAWEIVSAYVNNGNSNLNNGSVVLSADGKYKNVYAPGATDSESNNYNLTINSKGEALWETSNAGVGTASWNSDYSYMAKTDTPWVGRGGYATFLTGAGGFLFDSNGGAANSVIGFRPVLMVGSGL